MTRFLALLRSPIVRWAFLAVALAFTGWFVWANRESIVTALTGMNPWYLAAAVLTSVLYVVFMMESWRRVVIDLGNPLGFRSAVPLFGISQLGKYIPGGVWNIAAAAQLGANYGIARRHSVAAMTIALLVSLASGVSVGALGFLISPAEFFGAWGWVLWAGVPLLVVLIPPVTNALIALAWRLLRLEPLETAITTRGIAAVTAWCLAGWLAVGLSVALLAMSTGAEPSLLLVARATAGYALAWVAGFVIVIAPAGAGVREVVLAASLMGTIPEGAVVAIVLISRLILTVADLALAGVGAIDARMLRNRSTRQDSSRTIHDT